MNDRRTDGLWTVAIAAPEQRSKLEQLGAADVKGRRGAGVAEQRTHRSNGETWRAARLGSGGAVNRSRARALEGAGAAANQLSPEAPIQHQQHGHQWWQGYMQNPHSLQWLRLQQCKGQCLNALLVSCKPSHAARPSLFLCPLVSLPSPCPIAVPASNFWGSSASNNSAAYFVMDLWGAAWRAEGTQTPTQGRVPSAGAVLRPDDSAATGQVLTKGDPHLIGRHGEKFEFHGQDGASYCLVSDRKVQINMHLFAGAKNGSTYIDEIGVVTSSGIHIVVSAQSAADVSPEGVQGQLEVNSASMPDDILTIDLLRHTVRIERRKTSVRVRVRGVVDLTVDILPDLSRKSHPNYLNIRIVSLHASHKVHGIIGQTYQDSASRLSRFSASQGKNGPSKERAVIDGKEQDYKTSGILDADCKFQQFEWKPAG
ncbi:unnamed protein product [Closterium sp. NIES-64]|nr:unnamed protein product [Closterium sp. NIES-64]